MRKEERKLTTIRSLIFYFLIVICSFSCPTPFDMQTYPQELPQGFGSFSLRAESARTILPGAPALADFAAYSLAFTTTSGGTDQTVDRTNANLTDPVTLAVGTYSLTVSAYLGPGKTRLAAQGTLTGIAINSGAQVSQAVTLKPLALGTAGANGTFSWNINISASGVTSAKMEITKDGTAVSGSPVTLNTSGVSTSSLTLASGKYNVRITLTKDDAQAVWDELLYVYPELTSNFPFTFTDEFFYTTHYTVTFDYNNGETNGTQSVIHGGKITDPASAATWPLRAGLYPDPLPDNLTIEGWYRDGSTTKWNFTDNAVTENLTLYAKWSPIIDISSHSGNNDVEKAVAYVNANATKSYTLLVGGDVSVSSQTLNASNFNLTIQGYGGARTITYGNTGNSLFNINTGATLTLGENITLKRSTTGNASNVNVAGGTLIMNTGSKITGIVLFSGNGAAVSVTSGTFTMNGGEISGNKAQDGGGVYVNGGTFTMNGGEISGNEAAVNGGGVYVTSIGTFTMSGSASVSGNTVGNTTGKTGGGVYVDGGTFAMNDNASVSDNTAYEGGGVYISGGTFTMNNGTISGNTISNNGGGVYVTSSGIFNMHNGTISDHTANHGGGVQAHDYGNFNMYGGTISGNKVTTGGGGVRIENNSNFNMTGGTISGNTVSATTGTGGGVYVSANTSKFTMTGGTISGNSVTNNNNNSNGGGVYVINGSSFTVGGTAKISGNTKGTTSTSNNVYLPNNTYITLGTNTNAPTNGMGVWVQTATASGVIVNSGAASGNENYFHADDTDKVVVLQGGQLLLAWNVYDAATLQKVGRGTGGWTRSAYYKQTADIDLTSNWTRIGTDVSSSFIGTYNGGGHTISGLTITASAGLQGMFGYIGTGGIVENLGLINVNINGGTNNDIGGIAGYNGGTIQNCYVSGSVTGDFRIGGIAGNNSGTIQNCYVSGSVRGSLNIGGIAGENGNGKTIRNCVALNQSVTRSSGTDTRIGRVSGTSTGTLQNNYGWSGMTLTVSASPSTDGSGKDGADVTAAQAKTESWWKDAGKWDTTSPWDFTNVWQWNTNGMPSLRVSEGTSTVLPWPTYLTSFTVSFNADDGTPAPSQQIIENGGKVTEPTAPTKTGFVFGGWFKEAAFTNEWDFATDTVSGNITLYAKWEVANSPSNPFSVGTALELSYVGKGTANPDGYKDWTLSAHYKQTANITLSSGTNWTKVSGMNNFNGSYNGGGYTISGLTMNGVNSPGMFGEIGFSGKVENLGLIDVNITSTNNDTGGIAMANYGIIQNCYVSGSVKGKDIVGGIVGENSGTIQNCYVIGVTASITSSTDTKYVGGIAGINSGTILNCVALNESVTNGADTANIGRVSENYGSGTRQNNYGWTGMTLTIAGTPQTPTSSTTGKDGADITAAQAKTESWWKTTSNWNTTSQWDFTDVWQWDDTNSRPVLRGEFAPQAWPNYLVDGPPPIVETVLVQGGSFQMGQNGSGGTGDVTPVHTVTLSGFYISKYEVTQWQFEDVTESLLGSHSNSWTAPSGEENIRPVENVSWYHALVFCNMLSMKEGLSPAYSINGSTNPSAWGSLPFNSNATWNAVTIVSGSTGYRLPTEAQWEYAAKGGLNASSPYKIYSGSDTLNDVAWNGGGMTHEVGQKQANELGIYDMSGNVWEWCWDWYDANYYTANPQNDPMGPSSGSTRVLRGASVSYNDPLDAYRSAYRAEGKTPDDLSGTIGFRVVRPAP